MVVVVSELPTDESIRMTEINGKSTSVVWPTLGSRTAKSHNSIISSVQWTVWSARILPLLPHGCELVNVSTGTGSPWVVPDKGPLNGGSVSVYTSTSSS